MPRSTETPVILAQVNHWSIPWHEVLGGDTPNPVCNYDVERSFVDEDGEKTLIDRVRVRVDAEELLPVFASPTTGQPLFEETASRLYAHAVEHGHIPADAVDD